MLNDMFDVVSKADIEQNKSSKLIERRKKLLSLLEQEHGGKKGKVVLFAPFEMERDIFVQDSTFYYYSGISEPALALTFDAQEGSVLYAPDFGDMREKWVHAADILNEQTISLFGINHIRQLGNRIHGYSVGPYFSSQDYQFLIEMLQGMVARKELIFTPYPAHSRHYAQVKQIIDRLQTFIPELKHYLIDISPFIAQQRRKKDISEIEQMYQAVNVTHAGFEAAARLLRPGINEAELQAAIAYIFTENDSCTAYPSIVAGGKRATILHYHANNQTIKEDELVLIDAGAMYKHYCADITRVFPASGRFTDRQKELYEVVLETQEHVVGHIRPGVWLSNQKEQEASLQHIAMQFLKKKGYDSFFIHGVSHFLGLDVHDVGDVSKPLEEGDVITVEPGVYLEEESVGIRIEDNYWVVNDASPVCLSESIPKAIKDVEEMVEERFDIDVR